MGRVRNVRNLLDRLRREQGGVCTIAQRDGSVARFTFDEMARGYLRASYIFRARIDGEPPPPWLPIHHAIKNAATHEKWHDSYLDFLETEGPVEDLSE